MFDKKCYLIILRLINFFAKFYKIPYQWLYIKNILKLEMHIKNALLRTNEC